MCLELLVKSLSAKLQESQSVENDLYEIVKSLKSEKDKKTIEAIAVKVISILCVDLEKRSIKIDYYIETYSCYMFPLFLFTEKEKYRNFALQNIKFFLYFLLKKKAIDQLEEFFKNFHIEKINSVNSYQLCFDIVKNVQFCIVQTNEQTSSNEIQKCFENLQKCLEVPDENVKLKFLIELFNNESAVEYIYKHHRHSNNFISYFFSNIKITKFSNFNDFFVFITELFIYFTKAEIRGYDIRYSLQFLKAVIENENIKKNLHCHYFLTVLYYLSKLKDIENFPQPYLKDILSKLSKLFHQDILATEVWFSDFIITFIQLNFRIINVIIKDINEDNLVSYFDLIIITGKKFVNMEWKKRNCWFCKYFKAHELMNLLKMSLDLFGKFVNLKIKHPGLKSLLEDILTCKELQNKQIFNDCKNLTLALRNNFKTILRIISQLDDEYFSRIALHLLNILASFVVEKSDKTLIVRSYKFLYKVLKEKLLYLEYQALYISYIADSTNDQDCFEAEIYFFIKSLIDLNLETSTINEVIENSTSKFKLIDYNRKYLGKKHIEICLNHQMITSGEAEILLRKTINQVELSILELILMIRQMKKETNAIDILEKCDKIKYEYNLDENNKTNLKYNLALAHLYKYEANCAFDRTKNMFELKIISEEFLSEINLDAFEKINMIKECKTIEPALRSINFFSKVLKLFNAIEDLDKTAILEDLSYLARNFHLRGHIDYACETWNLLYKFATNYCKCDLSQIQAISFFCKHVHFLEKFKSNSINVNAIVNSMSEKILEKYHEIDALSPRKQNYVLLCILNVGYYYAYQHDFKSCKALLKMVEDKINNMDARKNTFELVRANLFALEFQLRTKFQIKLNVSPYIFIHNVLKEFKTIVYITTEDSLNMACFMIEFIAELLSYLLIMLDTKMIISCILYILSFSLDYGIIVRIANIFATWAKVNLHSGDPLNFLIKLSILDKMLMVEKHDDSETVLEKYKMNASKLQNSIKKSLPDQNNLYFVESVRKAVQFMSLFPECLELPISVTKNDLSNYFTNHPHYCQCNICQHPTFQMLLFQIGCLYLHMYIRNKDKAYSKSYFEEALKWMHTFNPSYFKILYKDCELSIYFDYIKILRANENYTDAICACEKSSEYIEQNVNIIVTNVIWKVLEQQISINYLNNSADFVTESPTPTHKKKITKKILKSNNASNSVKERSRKILKNKEPCDEIISPACNMIVTPIKSMENARGITPLDKRKESKHRKYRTLKRID